VAKRFALALLLVAAALAGFFSVPQTQATDWCAECAATADCYACCRCDGGSHQTCIRILCVAP
jgi:hypothetical protein